MNGKFLAKGKIGKLTIGILLLIVQTTSGGCFAQEKAQSGFAISQGQTSAVAPFELEDNRIFVDVKINGRGPFHFILDSGAGNALTPEVASILGLKLENPFPVSGVGEQTEQGWRTVIDSIELGNIKGANQKFLVFSLAAIKNAIGFEKLDGLIGFELFSSFVAKIDYENNKVTFIEPTAFAYRGNGTVIGFQLSGHIPQIDGEVDGLRGKLKIDTGDRSSLTLFVPFVENNNLREKYAPKIAVITGWGIGGAVKAQVVRTGVLKLGEIPVTNVIARLPLLKSGGFTEREAIGSIGTGILKKFNVTFDYSRKQLILEKNVNYSVRDEYDRAGMWLSRKGLDFEVSDVVAGSPADQTGIKIGDRILAVNGKFAKELSLPQVRLMLNNAQKSASIKLTVKSGERQDERLLTLRELI